MVDPAPLSDLVASLPADARDGFGAVFETVNSMNADYHECQGHSSMSLDEHIARCGLSAAGAAFVRSHLHDGAKVAIEWAGRRIEVDVGALQYVEGGRVYVP